MALGVPYDTFWRLNPQTLEFYIKGIREQENRLAWLQGSYVAEAISACFSKNYKYPSKPHEMEPPEPVGPEAGAERFREFMSAFNAAKRERGEVFVERGIDSVI